MKNAMNNNAAAENANCTMLVSAHQLDLLERDSCDLFFEAQKVDNGLWRLTFDTEEEADKAYMLLDWLQQED
jgi:hypothetical protein